MTRTRAVEQILAAFSSEPMVVALGATSREVIAISQGENHLHVLDSMGLPPAIGLGIALGLRSRYAGKVVVLEGDGGLLMGLSTLSTIGLLRPENLVLLVLDNGTYAATGGQATAASAIDFSAVAGGCRIHALDVDDDGALRSALAQARAAAGPILVRIRIDQTTRLLPSYLPDPPVLTDRFRHYLRGVQHERGPS